MLGFLNYKKSLSILFLFVCTNMCATGYAKTDAPVLVEMFSSIDCPSDLIIQKSLQNLAKDYPNLILLNCRTGEVVNKDAQQIDKYKLQGCGYKAASYFQKLSMFSMKSPLIVINGKYDSNNADIPAAINLTSTIDHVKSLKIKKTEKAIQIEIPDFDQDLIKSELFLYTYRPTHEIKINAKTPPTEDNQELPKSDPFEAIPEEYTEFYLRPVIDIQKIEDWDKSQKQIFVPIKNLDTFELGASELSYIAVLSQGKSPGDVIAVGELKSEAEKNTENYLPHSEAIKN